MYSKHCNKPSQTNGKVNISIKIVNNCVNYLVMVDTEKGPGRDSNSTVYLQRIMFYYRFLLVVKWREKVLWATFFVVPGSGSI